MSPLGRLAACELKLFRGDLDSIPPDGLLEVKLGDLDGVEEDDPSPIDRSELVAVAEFT